MQEAQQPEPEQQHLEREDPNQPNCAISAEPFDKVYDPELDDWFYKDARRIHGEEAERYGVDDGAIVKVKCLAEAGGLLGPGAAGLGEDGNIAGDMAAAAMEAEATSHAVAALAAREGSAGGRGDDTAAEMADLGLEGEEMGAAVAEGMKEEGDVKGVMGAVVKEEPVEVAAEQQQQVGQADEGPKLEAAAEGEVLVDSNMGEAAAGGVKRESSLGQEELDQGEAKRIRLSPA